MVSHRLTAADSPEAATTPELRQAYEQGRKDERRERKRHPVFMTFLFAAAAAGAIIVALAAINGSFGRAGGVVDQNLTVAAGQAEPVVRDAAGQAGQSLRDAGQSVKDKVAEKAH